MDEDIRDFVQNCRDWQIRKSKSSSNQGKLQIFPSLYPFHTVCMDILGLRSETVHGNKYVLVCVDRFTRWPELVPLTDMTASTTADAFFEDIIYRHSVPERVLTDRGSRSCLKG
jgi:hypothetical protein